MDKLSNEIAIEEELSRTLSILDGELAQCEEELTEHDHEAPADQRVSKHYT